MRISAVFKFSFLESHPDIKFLRKHNLIDDKLIPNLIRDRSSVSRHIITTDNITKEEFLKQIKIELNLIEICKQEIKKNVNPSVSDARENSRILTIMSNNIDNMYFSIFQTFSFESGLLIEYMEFQSKNKKYITNELHSLVDIVSNKICHPELYIAAATYEYENKNIEIARKYFTEGKKHHRSYKPLYLEEFWMEVQHLEDTKGETFQTAFQKYSESVRRFRHDMEFNFMLFEKSLQSKLNKKLQYCVLDDLVGKYKSSDLMWQEIAMLCCKGFIYDHYARFFDYTTDNEIRARYCINTYKVGMENVFHYGKKRNLSRFFTEYIVSLWKSNESKNKTIDDLVNTTMEEAFQMGHTDHGGLHKPEYYVYWAEHRYEQRPEILKLAISKNKDNVDVWAEVLGFYIKNCGSIEWAKKIFNDGVLALKNKSLLLWEMMDSFLQNVDLKQLEDFYAKGAKSPYGEINTVYRVEYLQWYNLYNDIFSTRELFNTLVNIAPESKKLYTTMIEFEKLIHPVNVDLIRNLYNLVCTKFGVDDVSLWTDFIQFEFKNGLSLNADDVYNSATESVKSLSKSVLQREYNLLKEKHRRCTSKIDPVVIDGLDANQ